MKSEIVEIIRLPIKHHPYSNCIQDVFITYLKWKNEDYKKLFDHTWSFQYKENSCFEIDIYRDGFSSLYDSLLENYGLRVIENATPNTDIIQAELIKRMPIIANVDTYYCAWHRSYQKHHNEAHYILINGLRNGKFICLDPYYSSERVFLSCDELEIALNTISTLEEIEISNCKKTKSNNLCNVEKLFGDTYGRSDFDKMKMFAQDIWDNKERVINTMKEYSDLAFWPFLLKLNNIAYGRKCYSTYHKEYGGDIGNIRQELDLYSIEWSRISSLFIKFKAANFPDNTRKRIYDKLLLLSAKEEKLANDLYKMLRGR